MLFSNASTDIFIGNGALSKLSFYGKAVLLSDKTVFHLHGKQVLSYLCPSSLPLVVEPGEQSKTPAVVSTLRDAMVSAQLNRGIPFITLGGGVITDLGGYVSGTYMRGLDLTHIPTTLLGMVDAAIGSKVAINHAKAKNVFGLFYPPKQILIDPNILQTLPKQELENGEAEIIKMGLIYAPKLLKITSLQERIIESIQAKIAIVEKDPYGDALRTILNFGHTVGHAIEASCSFQIAHGRAIILGMLAEGYLSYLLKRLSYQSWQIVYSVLKPFQIDCDIKPQKIMEFISMDKKMDKNTLYMPLLRDIGDVAIHQKIEKKVLYQAVEWVSTWPAIKL